MTEKIRVLLAEDNEDLRVTMQILMEDEPDMVCIASTGVLGEVAALTAEHDPDVVVLDVQLKGGSSLPLLPALCAAQPRTAFLMHSGYSDPVVRESARKAGAAAWVLKSGDTDALFDAVRSACGR